MAPSPFSAPSFSVSWMKRSTTRTGRIGLRTFSALPMELVRWKNEDAWAKQMQVAGELLETGKLKIWSSAYGVHLETKFRLPHDSTYFVQGLFKILLVKLPCDFSELASSHSDWKTAWLLLFLAVFPANKLHNTTSPRRVFGSVSSSLSLLRC